MKMKKLSLSVPVLFTVCKTKILLVVIYFTQESYILFIHILLNYRSYTLQKYDAFNIIIY